MTDEEWLQLARLYREAEDELRDRPYWRHFAHIADPATMWPFHDEVRERINQKTSTIDPVG